MTSQDTLHVGQRYELRRTFSEDEVRRFADLSLDTNPLHTDPAYAAQSRFGRTIVPGFLSASLFSAIIGTRMPGEGTIYLKQEMRFMHPVYPGQEVVATVTVTELMPERGRALLSTTCHSADGTLLIDGQALVKLP